MVESLRTLQQVSDVCYAETFLSNDSADDLFDWCESGAVIWQQESLTIFGKTHRVPRLTAWFGDSNTNYRYAGVDHRGEGWPSSLQNLRGKLSQQLDTSFNFVLINKYHHGRDHMGWHRDDEKGIAPTVASVSLGGERRFRWRNGPGHPSQALDLAHGSLVTFDGHLQHMLARTRRAISPRINLTFRQLDCD